MITPSNTVTCLSYNNLLLFSYKPLTIVTSTVPHTIIVQPLTRQLGGFLSHRATSKIINLNGMFPNKNHPFLGLPMAAMETPKWGPQFPTGSPRHSSARHVASNLAPGASMSWKTVSRQKKQKKTSSSTILIIIKHHHQHHPHQHQHHH